MKWSFRRHNVDSVNILGYIDFAMDTVPTILGDIYVDDQGGHDENIALLWPSLFTDHRMWRFQVPALRAAGFRTLVVDPPGHGQSKGPDRGFTMDECAKAALQVLDATGVHKPVVLLGTSWGGMVAPRIALLAPERVRGMILFNTTADSATLFEWARATLLTKMLAISALDKLVDNMVVSLQLAPGTRSRNPELGVDLSNQFRSWDRKRLINSVRSVLVDRDSALDRLHGVNAPVVLVSGKEDPILPAPHSRRMVERMPHARHIDMAGAAHLVPLEAAEESTKLILGFLTGLP